MELYEVRVTDHALEQMQEIIQYISGTLQAPDAARDLLNALKTEMAKCAEFPARNPLLPREPWRSHKIRRIIVKNFYAYYHIDEEHNEVWFIAVVYAKRDQAKELLDALS